MAVGAVNGAQNPSFVELVNQPQVAYANNAPQMSMAGQPEFDSYEGPRQEKKESSFLVKALKTLLVVGAAVGLNRYAHSQGWIETVEKDATGFANKYLKKPLNVADEWVVKTYENYFPKEAAKAASTEPAKQQA